jgi:TonB family protein
MRKSLIVGSIVVHAAAVVALSIAAMWKIEKLPIQDRGGVVASFQLPHDTGGGAAPKQAPLIAKKDKVKVRPKDLVQPDKRKVEQDVAVTDSPTADVIGDSTEGLPGNGTGGDGLGKDKPSGGCVIEPCPKDDTTTTVVKKKEEVVKKKTTTITIPETDASRVSGNSRIEAPQNVKIQMQRADVHRVLGTIKLCVNDRGSVTRASVAKSTGYDDYDDKLVSEMSDWRYQPLVRDGAKTPFCTFVTLVYLMK